MTEEEVLAKIRDRAAKRLTSLGIMDGGITIDRPILVKDSDGDQFSLVDDLRQFIADIRFNFGRLGLHFYTWTRSDMDFWMLSRKKFHEDLLSEQISHLIMFAKYNVIPEDRLFVLAAAMGLLPKSEMPKKETKDGN